MENGYFQNATTKGDDKGQEILHKLFQSNQTQNPMTTTAEENKWTYKRDASLRAYRIFYNGEYQFLLEGAILTIEKVCDKFNALEKLREAEVSDLKRYSPSVNKKYPLTVDLVEESDGILFRVEEVLPKIAALEIKTKRLEQDKEDWIRIAQAAEKKIDEVTKSWQETLIESNEQVNTIAQLQAESEVLKEELSGGVHSCRPNCQNPTCIIRKERDQLQTEKERMVGVLKKIGKIHSESVSAQLANEALASLPEVGKDVGVKVGDYIKGSWRDPATGKTYFAEGTVRQFDAGLFVQEGDDGGITNLELFFNFSVINRTELPEEK